MENRHNNYAKGKYNTTGGNRSNYEKRSTNGSKTANEEKATTPYNFVSLPPNAVPAYFIKDDKVNEINDEKLQKKYIDYVKNNGKYSGFLELEIETLTPCFINSMDTIEDNKDEGKSFFKIGDYYLIAGSSLRGMIKNIFKIISGGAMRPSEDLDDKRLYFRRVAARNNDSLKDDYKKALRGEKPGFLIRLNTGEYYICPGYYPASSDGNNKDDGKMPANGNKRYLDGLKVYWEANKAVDCVSGYIGRKSHYIRIHYDKFDKRIEIPKAVVKAYEEDIQRAEGFNVLDSRYAKRNDEAQELTGQKDIVYVMPCFYTLDNDNKVKNFGHCTNYRVPYSHTIGEFVPLENKNCFADITDAVFGKKNLWSSRVYFEDAVADNSDGEPFYYEAKMPRPLASPKPTSYQLYLKQGNSNVAENHWGKTPDNNNSIRGYKFYWHNSDEEAWKQQGNDKVLPGMKKIAPLMPGVVFRGRIRFQQLSDIELGALCAVFHLGDNGQNIAYKIGQGKSIGMGSIKIKTNLYLDNTSSNNIHLFADDNQGWNNDFEKHNLDEYIEKFENYRDSQLTNVKGFYNSQKQLFALLDYNDYNVKEARAWANKISYMGVTDPRFKYRVPLDNTLFIYNNRNK